MADQIRIDSITLEDVQLRDEQGLNCEVLNGQWLHGEEEQEVAGKRYSKIGARLIARLLLYVEDHDLGEVYQDQLHYVLTLSDAEQVETLLIPDVSFVSRDRVVHDDPDKPYFIAPDLAVEITSPSNRNSDIEKKIDQYLTHGTKQVWQVYPSTKEIVVYKLDALPKTYQADNVISGGDLIPGFELVVNKIFGDK